MSHGKHWKPNKVGSFSERIAYWINRRKVKLAEIKDKTGISTGTLSLWCNGRVMPKADNLRRLCAYLGIEEKYLDPGYQFKEAKK